MIVERIIHQTASWTKPVKDICSIVDVFAMVYFGNRLARKEFRNDRIKPVKAVVQFAAGISGLLQAKRWQDQLLAIWDTGWAIWSFSVGVGWIERATKAEDSGPVERCHGLKGYVSKYNKVKPSLYSGSWAGRINGMSGGVGVFGKLMQPNKLKENATAAEQLKFKKKARVAEILKEAGKALSALEVLVRRWHTPALLMLGR